MLGLSFPAVRNEHHPPSPIPCEADWKETALSLESRMWKEGAGGPDDSLQRTVKDGEDEEQGDMVPQSWALGTTLAAQVPAKHPTRSCSSHAPRLRLPQDHP